MEAAGGAQKLSAWIRDRCEGAVAERSVVQAEPVQVAAPLAPRKPESLQAGFQGKEVGA